MSYTAKTFTITPGADLSPAQLELHLGLYAGYVKNLNLLNDQLALLKSDRSTNTLAISELTRRIGFEFNGMRLHELYFEQLSGNGEVSGPLATALATQWGSIETWKEDFEQTCLFRGIGWGILSIDVESGQFYNSWVSDHEIGHLAGLPIILAVDMWEHAYLIDYKPSQKTDYLKAIFARLNWSTLDSRLAN
ncbi:MAG: Fe-Mn family superoxide dismutase [Patescibacteria group bacterium]